jgi:hypothetical protein
MESTDAFRDMDQFFLLFEEWEAADQAAARADCCLGRCLDAYCDGMGPVPSAAAIAEAKRLRADASQRLRAIRVYVERARRNARVI